MAKDVFQSCGSALSPERGVGVHENDESFSSLCLVADEVLGHAERKSDENRHTKRGT